jgi:carboxymethylenebutenolidase
MEAFKEFIDSAPSVWSDTKAREEALALLPEPRRSHVAESMAALTAIRARPDALVPKLIDAANFLRADLSLTRVAKVGSVGFCMGGGLSGRLACADPEVAAAVIFYGTAAPIEQVPNIACPVLGFYGGLDARVNAGIPGFAVAMEKHGKRFEHHVYAGVQHAFFNDNRPAYRAQASRDAFARTLEWFRQEL